MRTGRLRLPSRQAGFTYMAMLVAVGVMGVWLAATGQYWHLQVQREREQELLQVGHEWREALLQYAASTQGGGRRLPQRLEDLLLDDRFAQKRRHLRRIPVDPITGSTEWGVVRTVDGQINGVHSLSEAEPLKKAGFELADIAFTGRTAYNQWIFSVATRAATPRPSPGGAR